MDKSNLSLQLIKNTYDAEDAKELITQLLCDKITFINRKIFSLEERFGIHSPFLENRVKELNDCKTELNDFFEMIASDDIELRIECPINVEVVQKSSNQQIEASKEENSWT